MRRWAVYLFAERRQPSAVELPRRRIQEAGVRSHGRRPERTGDAGRERSPPRSRPSITSARRSPRRTVKYKVLRTKHSQNWYPIRPWDWCFGPGYWWFGYDYAWYPGWSEVGRLRRPMPWWFWRGNDPPEVVAEREVEIGRRWHRSKSRSTPLLAKECTANTDHKYTHHRRSRDESRRTIVGHGRRPGRPQAVQGVHLGRSRLLPRGRHDRSPFLAPKRSTKSRSKGKGC